MRQRVQYFLPMVTLVALSGCGETATEPIEPTAALDEVAAQAVVVEATDARLPHLPSLVHEALEVVQVRRHPGRGRHRLPTCAPSP